jgi:hypothetical protein
MVAEEWAVGQQQGHLPEELWGQQMVAEEWAVEEETLVLEPVEEQRPQLALKLCRR